MTKIQVPPPAIGQPVTYEQYAAWQKRDFVTFESYMAEPYLNQRFDILDGVRTYKPTSRQHQDILGNLMLLLRDFERVNRSVELLILPFDLMFQREPLRIRQPDAMAVRAEHRSDRGTDGEPLQFAPEVVFEILEKREAPDTYRDALADYAAIGVKERWLINPQNLTVSVLRVTPSPTQRIALYEPGQIAQSPTLPGLVLSVDAIFAEA